MLTYSPQAAFFLALFQLVPSALALTALAAVRFWEGARPRAHGSLMAGTALYTIGLGLQAAYCRFAVAPSGHVELSMGWLLHLADAVRAAAIIALGAAFLQRSGRGGRVRAFCGATLALLVLAVWRLPSDQGAVAMSIDPATALRGAEVIGLLLGVTFLGLAAPLSSIALTFVAMGRAGSAIGATRPAWTEGTWGVGTVLVLAGLLLLPIALEQLSQRRVLHYVLRFNLTFLALAASLVMVLSEISRRQFVEFSAEQVQDVAELLRGQIITGLGRGDPPEAVLARPEMTADIIREFGRYSNLRRVTLECQGQSMALAINDVGEIDQQHWRGPGQTLLPVAPADFTEATLLERPVVVDGASIGRIELRQSVVGLNVRIGEQMRVAFGVFTMFVVVGSLVTGILVLVADQTIRRQDRDLAEAQRRLLASERLASVGAVADAVAHEVNNPAGVLIARSDYLLSVARGQPWAADVQDDLDTIRRQAQRIAKTVQDLLSSTRRSRLAREAVDVGGVVQSAITLVRPLAKSREISFENGVEPGTLCVSGDYGRIEQVFVNLLSNASQAMPDRGRVVVTASERPGGTWIDIEVADTGMGIHPEHLSHIFERFFTTKEPGMGSGLGLSIVAGIVREHGGHIDVESKLGHGTRFRVTLRAGRAGGAATTEPVAGAAALKAPERS